MEEGVSMILYFFVWEIFQPSFGGLSFLGMALLPFGCRLISLFRQLNGELTNFNDFTSTIVCKN